MKMTSATSFIRVNDPVPTEQLDTIASLDNNSLIIRLAFTINHLSRWLSPIHDHDLLERSVYRGEPTAKDLVLQLRDYDQKIYPRMYLIANQNDPDLDTLPDAEVSDEQRRRDQVDPTIVVMSSFRRLRQTSTALLRALDRTLDQVGAREGLAKLQVTPLDELLTLAPDGGVDIRV